MTSAKTRERAPLHLRGMLWFAVLFVWGFQATCFLWGGDRLIHLTKIGLVVHALFMTAACAHAHLQTKWDVFTQTLAIVTVDLSAFIQAGAFALVLFGPTDVGLIGESLDDYGDALTELGNFYEHGVPLGVALLTTAAVGAETRDGIGSSTHPLVTLGITLNGILIYALYYDPTEVYELQDEARPWLFLTVMKRGQPVFQIYAMNAAHAELLHSLANNDPNVRGCLDVIRGVAQAAVDLEDPTDGETMEIVLRLIEQAVTYGVMFWRVLDTEGRSVSKADFRADPETELGDMEVMLRGDIRHLGEETRATEMRVREKMARRMKTRSDQDMRRNAPRRPRRLRNKYRIVPLDMADCKMVLRYELRTGLMAMLGMPREKTGIQGEERGKYIFTKIITPPDRWRVDMAGARFASPVARCLEYHFMRQRMYDAELMAMERNAARTVLRQPPGAAQNISDLQSAASHNILQSMLPNHNVTGVPGYYVEDEAELGQVEAVNRFFEHTRDAALRRQQQQQAKADQDYLDPLQRQVDATRAANTYEQYRKFRVDRKRVESARNSTRPIDAGELKDQTPFTHSRNMPDMLREIQNSICEMMGVPVAVLGVVAAGRSDRTTTADGATPSPQVYNNIAGIMIAVKGIMDRVMPGRMEVHTREAVQRASIRPDQFALLKGVLSRREMRRIIGFTSETDELDAVIEERMFDLMTARAEGDQLAEMVKDAAGRTDLTSSEQMAKVADALAAQAEKLRQREERMALAARAASNNGEGSAGSAPSKPTTRSKTASKRASKSSSGAAKAKAKAEGGAEDGGAKRPSKQRPSAEGGTGQRTGDEKPSKRAK